MPRIGGSWHALSSNPKLLGEGLMGKVSPKVSTLSLQMLMLELATPTSEAEARGKDCWQNMHRDIWKFSIQKRLAEIFVCPPSSCIKDINIYKENALKLFGNYRSKTYFSRNTDLLNLKTSATSETPSLTAQSSPHLCDAGEQISTKGNALALPPRL
jgi:hypothetical protein